MLPRFLVANGEATPADSADILAGFRLTGYFLQRHVYEPRGIAPPEARSRFIGLLERGP